MRLRKTIGISTWLLIVVVAFNGTSWSQESIVSPSETADVYGDSALAAGAAIRIHFLYPAADFMSLPESHRSIAELAYRPGRGNTLTDPVSGPLTLRLSTTDAHSLSTVLANNTGDDETLVFDGELTWQTDNMGPGDFDFVVPFDEPFTYDPSLGKNLLVDFSAHTSWDNVGNWEIDVQSTDYISGATANSSDRMLLVSQFTFVPTPPLGDCDGNGILDAGDLGCVSSIGERDAVLTALQTLPGDLDGNGDVSFTDFLTLSSNFGGEGNYTDGNIDLEGDVAFPDFLLLSSNFGKTAADGATAAVVPEPSIAGMLGLGSLLIFLARRHRDELLSLRT